MSKQTQRTREWPVCGISGHRDPFVRNNLPPHALWPDMGLYALPEALQYPEQLNVTSVFLDRNVSMGFGARPAIFYCDMVWSYNMLKDYVDRIAQVLTEDMGIISGNRVLIYGFSNPMMAASILATWKVGAIVVPAMSLLRARELSIMIQKAHVQFVLSQDCLIGEIEGVCLESLRVETFSDTGEGDASLDHAISKKSSWCACVDTSADDPALIAFTSGTTGTPKGVVHFHREVLVMCDLFPRFVTNANRRDIYVGTPPLPFTFGLGGLLCFPLRYGAAAVLIEKPSSEMLLQAIEQHQCTMLYTSPVMYSKLLPLVEDVDVGSVRCFVSGGEHLPEATSLAFHSATGMYIIDGIGTTEMIHIIISAGGEDIRPGATGMVVPGYEVRIVDDEGNVLPTGEVGHLAVRGPTGCRYLNDEDRQREYVRDGWNITGDMFRTDEGGYFWYVARADDMIISSGYNIAGPEVESVLLTHPVVSECAVVGIPDPKRGTIVKAFVVLHDTIMGGDLVGEELFAHVRAAIALYKCPRAIEFVESLPRTQTGKIQRHRLRQQE